MIGLSPSFTQTVFVYLCICVFVFVYLVIQDSSQTNWNFLLPVRFLQLFCWGTLNGLKSVESIFPLSRSYFIFLRVTAVPNDLLQCDLLCFCPGPLFHILYTDLQNEFHRCASFRFSPSLIGPFFQVPLGLLGSCQEQLVFYFLQLCGFCYCVLFP